MAGQRFRRLTDLFVRGKEVSLPDGTFLWIQVPNAYERDECISDAQAGRARVVMSLKENGSERMKIEARLAEHGRDAMISDLVEAKVDAKYPEIIAKIDDDPEWTEKLTILRRTDFTQVATPATQAERDLVDKIFADWTDTLQRALDDEREWQQRHYAACSNDELIEDYLELWLDRRGGEVASAEYSLTESWFAARYCDATVIDGHFDHSKCDSHRTRVFEARADARAAPEGLQKLIFDALGELAMGGRDPKGSASPTNSSASSPTPSEAEESTPSTSTETPDAPPGTSSQPSTTP